MIRKERLTSDKIKADQVSQSSQIRIASRLRPHVLRRAGARLGPADRRVGGRDGRVLFRARQAGSISGETGGQARLVRGVGRGGVEWPRSKCMVDKIMDSRWISEFKMDI